MTITAPPVVPGFTEPVPDFNTQGDIEFSDNAQRMVNELPPFHEGMQAMAGWMHDTGQEVEQLAAGAGDDAASASGAAQAAGLAAEDAIDAKNATEALFSGVTPVGSGLLALPTPEGARYIRINADGSTDQLTAQQFLLAIGASDGMANPMTTAGDMIIGGPGGLPQRLAPGPAGFILGSDGAALVQRDPMSDDFDFGRYGRQRPPSRDVISNAGFNIDTDILPGESVWCARDTQLGTQPPFPPGGANNYRIDDYVISPETVNGNHSRYQIATPNTGTANIRDLAAQMIRYKTYDQAPSQTSWGAWSQISGSRDFQIVSLPSPTQATQITISGVTYRHDIAVDLRLGRWFQGYATNNAAYLPSGESVPSSFTTSTFFSTQRFEFIGLDDLPTDQQYIGYLNWCGWTLQGNNVGRGTVEFTVPAGWVLRWAGNVAAQFLGLTYFYAGPGNNASRFERIQITVNPLNKTVMLAYAEMSRRN